MSVIFCATVAAIWLSIGGTCGVEMFNANVRSVTQCNSEKAQTALKHFVVDRVEGNNFEMNGTLIIKENVPGPINITCIVERCMSEDKPDSCEYHTTYRIKNFCEEIGKPNKAWGNFLDNAKIKKECPLGKGEYHISKYKMDLSVLQPLALSRAYRVYWKVTITLDSPKYPNFFCMRNVCSLEPKNKLKRNRKP